MANSVPTLTNENWHMFQPSQLETSLAPHVSNPADPNAFPLMMSARFRNENAGANYQAQVDQMHAAQIAEAMMAQRNARMNTAVTALKDAGQTPGMIAGLQRMGVVDPGIDLSELSSGADQKAAALNMHNVGTGAGAAAQGGITGLTPAVQSAFGPTAGQTLPPAMVQAAGINANGRIAASGNTNGRIKVSINDGTPTFSGYVNPGEDPRTAVTRIGGGDNPITYRDLVPKKGAAPQSNSGVGGLVPSKGFGTSLPPAPGFVGGDGTDSSITGGIPQDMMPSTQAPSPTTSQAAAPSSGIAADRVKAAILQALPEIQRANPAAYADIQAAGGINPVPSGGSWGIKGASGKVYPLSGIAAKQ